MDNLSIEGSSAIVVGAKIERNAMPAWHVKVHWLDKNQRTTHGETFRVEAPDGPTANEEIAERFRNLGVSEYEMEPAKPAPTLKRNPKTFKHAYHWTKNSFLPNIAINGLEPGTAERCKYDTKTVRELCLGKVFFSLQPDRWYQKPKDHGKFSMTLLRVSMERLADAKWHRGVDFLCDSDEDPRCDKTSDLWVERKVPPEHIEIQHGGHWRKITHVPDVRENPPDNQLRYVVESTTWDGSRLAAYAYGNDPDFPVGELVVSEGERLLGSRTFHVDGFYVSKTKRGIGQRLYIEMMRALEANDSLLASRSLTRTMDAERVHAKLKKYLNGRIILDEGEEAIDVYWSVKAEAAKASANPPQISTLDKNPAKRRAGHERAYIFDESKESVLFIMRDLYGKAFHDNNLGDIEIVPLDEILVTEDLACEVKADSYAKHMLAGDRFPPVVISPFGELYDGHHRFKASHIAGYTHIPARTWRVSTSRNPSDRNLPPVSFEKLTEIICKEAARRTGHEWLGKIKARHCPQADQEHVDSERQFAHVSCGRSQNPLTICYAKAIEGLELEWKVGLVVHELGHLSAGGAPIYAKHSENDANEAGRLVTGIPVVFKGRLNLEFSKVPKWLKERVGQVW